MSLRPRAMRVILYGGSLRPANAGLAVERLQTHHQFLLKNGDGDVRVRMRRHVNYHLTWVHLGLGDNLERSPALSLFKLPPKRKP